MHFKFHWGYLDYLLRRLKTISLKGSVKEKQNIRTMNKKKSGNKQRKNPYPGDIPTNSPWFPRFNPSDKVKQNNTTNKKTSKEGRHVEKTKKGYEQWKESLNPQSSRASKTPAL